MNNTDIKELVNQQVEDITQTLKADLEHKIVKRDWKDEIEKIEKMDETEWRDSQVKDYIRGHLLYLLPDIIPSNQTE
jgi:DNA phosphorothioation-dependent restriction protein DptG